MKMSAMDRVGGLESSERKSAKPKPAHRPAARRGRKLGVVPNRLETCTRAHSDSSRSEVADVLHGRRSARRETRPRGGLDADVAWMAWVGCGGDLQRGAAAR